MAAPRKKPPVKKPPVKKTPKIVFREVAPEPKKKIVFKTTKDDSPKKSQPAKDVKSGGLRAQHLQEAKNKYNTSRNNRLLDLENKNKEVRRRNKITKFRIKSLDTKINDLKKVMTKYENTGSRVKAPKTGFLKGLGSRAFGAAGAIVDPTFLSGKGEGKLNNDPVTRSLEASSTMSSMYKKQKREIRQGPKLAVTGVKEGTTRRLAPTGSRKPAPGSNYSGQEKKIPRKPAPGANYTPKTSGNTSGVGGPGGARALTDVKAKKSGTSQAASVASSSGSSGGSQASKVGVGRQTRYQRNELAMEQRKRSSSKPKKSIFSLFRKG